MTADTLKTTRVQELYQDFLSGKLINKQEAVLCERPLHPERY